MDYPVEGSVTNPNSLILFCTQEGCTAKLGKEFSIDVPKGATERGFTLQVNKIEPDGTMVPASMKLISSIFELVKDDEVNLLKPVTLHLQYESSTLDKNHRAALFQYEETVGKWVE
ncbi:hypothetical protein BZG21_37165, partial [Escherichia coli]|nr:hypothetical protein [Escherichia coli]